jgi:hypothetical protein
VMDMYGHQVLDQLALDRQAEDRADATSRRRAGGPGDRDATGALVAWARRLQHRAGALRHRQPASVTGG